jgi:hypothetical protein
MLSIFPGVEIALSESTVSDNITLLIVVGLGVGMLAWVVLSLQ